jgi:TatD DNase family protein
MAPLVDSHAHLSLVAKNQGLAELFTLWSGSGGRFILDVGTEPGDLEARMGLCQAALRDAFPAPLDPPFSLKYSVGAWPGTKCLSDPRATLAALRHDLEAAPRGSVVALGEVGLDYHWMDAPRSTQMELFEGCCSLAREFGLPLIVHSREADADTLEVLTKADLGRNAVMHCYSYGAESAAAYLELGLTLSFSGSLTYGSSTGPQAAAVLAGEERILVETDSPYLTPKSGRGKRPSTPLDVSETLGFLARLRGVEPGVLAERIEANARRLFGV